MLAAFAFAVAASLLISPAARAGVVIDGTPQTAGCPPIADKPGAIPEVNYTGMQHITYCYGPINIAPGQNIIKLRTAVDTVGQKLWPQQPGYITRFDPEFVYTDGSVPRVDVLHLHHAVWAVNVAIPSSPPARRRRSSSCRRASAGGASPPTPGTSTTCSTTCWRRHRRSISSGDLTSSPTPCPIIHPTPMPPPMKTVTTKWMDVAGNPSLYPVFDALRSDGHNGTYTFPDQAPAADLHPCGGGGGEASWAPGSHGCLGAAQSWTVPANHPHPKR